MTDILFVEEPVINIDEYSTSVVETGIAETTVVTCEVEQPGDFVVVESTAIIEVEYSNECVIVETFVSAADIITVEMGLPGPAGTGGSTKQNTAIFINGISSAGILSDIVWIVDDKQLSSAVTDGSQVTVTMLVEAGYSEAEPSVTVNGVSANVVETSTMRWFTATAAVPLTVGQNTITATSSSGAKATVEITRTGAGPEVISIDVVQPVSPKTHFKSGDTVFVNITTDQQATIVTIAEYGASGATVNFPVSNGIAACQFPCSSVASSSAIRVSARNSFGTYGNSILSSLVPIDQVKPLASLSVAYGDSQFAVRNEQTVSVQLSGSMYSSLDWSIPPGFSDAGGGIFDCLRTDGLVTVAFSVVAHKASNSSSTTATASVVVCNQPPVLQIFIDGNPATLRRSPAGTSYTLRVTSDQQLMSLSVPGMTMSASADRKVWTGSFKVFDSTPEGTKVFSADASGASGYPGSVIGNFIVGGFTARSVTWPAFSRVAPLGLVVHSDANVSVVLGTKTLTRQADAVDRPNGFYVADANGSYNPKGSYIALSDVAFAASNTTGTLIGTVQEL